MMPPLAVPTPSPAPSVPSEAGSKASDGRDHPQGAGFDALLALLAGTAPVPGPVSPPPPSPASTPLALSVAGISSHPDRDGEGRRSDDDPAPGSLDALVAALAQQLSGAVPAVSPPVRPPADAAVVGQPPAPAAAPSSPPVPSAAGAPLTAPGPATTGPDPTASAVPATDGRPDHGSAVAALAHSSDRPGSPSPVAALAHSGDRPGSPSPVAALASGHDGGHRPDTAPGAAQDAPAIALPADTALPAPAGHIGRPASDEPGAVPARDPATTANAVAAGPLPAPAAATTAGPAVEAPAVTPASDTAPATPAAVADQIVSAVVPLHGRGDGRHEVTLELRPESLGTIRVDLSVEHQTVHLTLHAAEPATGGLLSAALPELRSALADAGLTAGHIGVGPGGHGSGQGRPDRPGGDGDEPGRRRAGASNGRDRSRTEPVPIIRPVPTGRLDVLL